MNLPFHHYHGLKIQNLESKSCFPVLYSWFGENINFEWMKLTYIFENTV